MSGHSKWNNIKRKKEKTDAAKAQIFTKIGKEMAIAIREGGGDPNNNSKLRELIAKAKANNVPNENIERCIKKFSGNTDIQYEEITYEGYGPGGVAVIVKTATDNRNRTAANIRSYFAKYHGNMGQTGCVGFLFESKGQIILFDEDDEIDEDKLMEVAMEAGAVDLQSGEHVFEIYTETDDVEFVYKVDNYYSKECDRSVRFDDPEIGVEWGIEDPILSEKDLSAPLLKNSDCNFVYNK